VVLFPVLQSADATRILSAITKRVAAEAKLGITQVVWNGRKGTRTGRCQKRSLVKVPKWTIDRLRVAMQHAALLDGRYMREPVGIHSQPGQLQQQWHTDYDPATVRSLRGQNAPLPASAMMSLQPSTKLILLDPPTSINIDCGWAVVFDGDVVHAGGGYAHANTRVHAYIDVRGATRAPNTVYVHTHTHQLVL
jgi:hypothetical protein